MASPFDESDFVDTEFQAAQKTAYAAASQLEVTMPAPHNRPPSREELDARVGDAQQRIAELKRAQEELERERAALEEARRRQVEFQTGREEMTQQLVRGIGLLEEAELASRREGEQMAKTLAELRDALAKVQGIQQEAWTKENVKVELTRALTTLENSRMEWNSARIKWPLLAGEAGSQSAKNSAPATPGASPFSEKNFLQLCQLGLALTWPVLLAGLAIVLALLLRK
jgi:hypothetical protein